MLAKFLLCNSGATAIEYRMTASLIGMVMIGAAGLYKGLQQSAMSGPATERGAIFFKGWANAVV